MMTRPLTTHEFTVLQGAEAAKHMGLSERTFVDRICFSEATELAIDALMGLGYWPWLQDEGGTDV